MSLSTRKQPQRGEALLRVTQKIDRESGTTMTAALDLLLRVEMWRDQMKTLRPTASPH